MKLDTLLTTVLKAGGGGGPAFTATGYIAEGDSRTQLTDTSSGFPWPAVLTRTTGLLENNVAEAGTLLLDMDGTDYPVQVAPLYSPSNCNLAIIAGGFNDFWIGGPRTAAQVHTSLQSWCAKARATGFGKIAVMTQPGGSVGTSSWTAGMETERLAYNTLVRNNYTTYADYLLDITTLPELSNPLNATYYAPDAIHWKQPTHDAIAAYAKTTLGLPNAGVFGGIKFNSGQTDAAITIAGDGRTIYTIAGGLVSSKATQSNSGGTKKYFIIVDGIGPQYIIVGIGNAAAVTSAYPGANANGMGYWTFNDAFLGGGGGSGGLATDTRTGDAFELEHDTVGQTIRIRRRRFATWSAWSPTSSTAALNAGPYFPMVALAQYSQVTADFSNWS